MNYTLKENEIFCCNSGCGKCEVYPVWDEYSIEISPCGNYKDAKSELVLQSECCNMGVFVWDTVKDDEVEIEC